MTTYVYKSTTGFPVNIDNYTITPSPGLYSKYQIDALDAAIGSTISRYDEGVLVTADSSVPVTATTNPVTGGISLSAGGVQVGGTASPYAFTSRALTDSDNGQTRVCASAQVATVNTGLPNGFGCAFKGAISFDGTATVTDVRTTGATNPWCGLVNTGTNNYDVVGTKA